MYILEGWNKIIYREELTLFIFEPDAALGKNLF